MEVGPCLRGLRRILLPRLIDVEFELERNDEDGFNYRPLQLKVKGSLDYFEEEIAFPQSHAALFFWRLTSLLNDKQ